jgi:hypothetical protein
LIPDRVHPAAGVHLVMAAALLHAWHAPAVVAAVEIDGITGAVRRTQNTAISGVAIGDAVSWTQDDQALPLAIDKSSETIELALRYSGVVKMLDQQILRVTSLAEGVYRLEIDGQETGIFDLTQMEQGVNLGPLSTPMMKQALAVQALAFKHNYLHLVRRRMLEDAFKDDHLPGTLPAVDALNILEEQAIELQHTIAQPESHHYKLIRIRSGQRRMSQECSPGADGLSQPMGSALIRCGTRQKDWNSQAICGDAERWWRLPARVHS